MKGSFTYRLFQEEPVGTFADGHVFVNAPDVVGVEQDSRAGYWRCDIAHDDRLTWSEKVYELFGLPAGTPVMRDWAVACYTEPSKTVLERVRTYALSRKLGFILDAAIRLKGGGHRWIRVLAVPILAKGSGRVVGLHGLKRPL
jgi:PAS domain-containing protein